MKETLKKYLDEYFKTWIAYKGIYPTVPYDEDIETELTFGEIDEEEYIQWKYKENTKEIEFEKLEKKHGIKIPQDVKEYYTSYFFLQLTGFHKGKGVWLDPITDYLDITSMLDFTFENECKDKIFIGIISNEDFPICVEIETGNIVIWDAEKEKSYTISDSLSDFIKELKVMRD